MYYSPFLLEDHSSKLVKDGWEYREVYIAEEGTWDEFSDSVSASLSFPDYYGRNLDAFRDCLGDVDLPKGGKLALGLERFDLFAKRQPREAQAVLDIFAGIERRYVLEGRRLLFMVQSNDPTLQFEPVGAQVAAWNFEEWLDSKRIRQ